MDCGAYFSGIMHVAEGRHGIAFRHRAPPVTGRRRTLKAWALSEWAPSMNPLRLPGQG